MIEVSFFFYKLAQSNKVFIDKLQENPDLEPKNIAKYLELTF